MHAASQGVAWALVASQGRVVSGRSHAPVPGGGGARHETLGARNGGQYVDRGGRVGMGMQRHGTDAQKDAAGAINGLDGVLRAVARSDAC